MTSTSTLPRVPLPRLDQFDNARLRYIEGAASREFIPYAERTSTLRAVSRLSSVERATVRLHCPTPEDYNPSAYGLTIDASAMLTMWAHAGTRMSGWELASDLQQFYFPRSGRARSPWRGWALLAAVDETAAHHGVTVSCATLVGDTYQRARLAQVLAARTG